MNVRKHVRLLIATLLPFVFAFSYANTADHIAAITTGDKEKRTEALDSLVENKKLSALPILGAINDKKLYLYQNEAVTIGDSRLVGEEKVYPLYRLYPKVSEWKNEKGKVVEKPLSDLEEIKFARTERLKIIPVLPFINLTSIDDERRKLAYTQFQNKGDKKTIELITEAYATETTDDMRRIARETILAIELQNTSDEDKQLEIIKNLVENQGYNTTYIIKNFVEQPTLDKNFKLKVERQLKIVTDRASRITVYQNFFSGISLGSILILVALGLSIIYGLAGVINMAHGEFMMIGAYTTFCIQEAFKGTGANAVSDAFFLLSLPLSFVVAGCFGLIIEKLILRKLYSKPLESLLATWGVSLVLIQLARTVFGDLTSVKTPSLLSGGWEIIPQLVLPYNRLFIIGMTIVIISVTYWFLYKTRNGLRIRSVTQNRSMSSCLGISTSRIDALTFFVGSGIAGVAGCCMTLIGNVVPDMGQTYIVDSFLVVVTGGVGNLFGTIVAGLGIGSLTKVLEPIFHAVYGKVIILIVIIVFLQFKPKGLFPAKGRIADE